MSPVSILSMGSYECTLQYESNFSELPTLWHHGSSQDFVIFFIKLIMSLKRYQDKVTRNYNLR